MTEIFRQIIAWLAKPIAHFASYISFTTTNGRPNYVLIFIIITGIWIAQSIVSYIICSRIDNRFHHWGGVIWILWLLLAGVITTSCAYYATNSMTYAAINTFVNAYVIMGYIILSNSTLRR